ncbi:MAG: Flp pilus assembly complex ATPase component TadA [Deltaproteobacteria bacterium]|jgi:general secretion pathway protein E|nr:Flp pilus assembly complex ATPase component TadA [Deltaproteobacteria bacterium]
MSNAVYRGKFTVEYLLNLLLNAGLIGQQQTETLAKDYGTTMKSPKSRTGGEGRSHPPLDPLDFIVSCKLPLIGAVEGRIIDDDVLAHLMASDSGLKYMRVEQRELDIEYITRILPRSFAFKHLVLPLSIEGNKLNVAVRHPFYQAVLEDVRRVANLPPQPVILSQTNLQKLIGDIYAFNSSLKGATGQYAGGSTIGLDVSNLEQYVKLKNASEITDDDQHIKNLVDLLFAEAFEGHASDIHLEPKREHLLVRMRFDGILHDMYRLPVVIHSAMVSRIKAISRLDIAERRRPQDGRIKIAHKEREAEIRVSTVPVAFGEKVVLRLLNPEALFLDLESMFFNPDDYARWSDFMSYPHGIILVSGPTGSGKTTTLYSSLRQLATSEVNVTTIEDPIEMIHEQFNQIAVQPKAGITFGSIIRTVLRQDPDIIMVGEMRDKETAENAVQAALTGHLVLSTIHTNDAPSAVTRLVELGMEPFLVTSTVIGIMAQRLVRRICPYCSDEYVMTKKMALDLGFLTQGDLLLRYGRGCDECRHTGYLGRVATVEVLNFSPAMKTMILEGNQNALDLKNLARREGMTTLRENALDLMLVGKTTIQEVLRVTAAD